MYITFIYFSQIIISVNSLKETIKYSYQRVRHQQTEIAQNFKLSL